MTRTDSQLVPGVEHAPRRAAGGSVAARSALCAALALLAPAGLVGCATDGDQRGRTQRQAPQQAPPERVVLAAAMPEDTNASGFADTTVATAYLFARAGHRGQPVTFPGEFHFTLTTSDGNQLAEWRFDPQDAADARVDTNVGVGHFFSLSLIDAIGTDEIPRMPADLVCRFIPDGDHPTATSRPTTVVIGGSPRR